MMYPELVASLHPLVDSWRIAVGALIGSGCVIAGAHFLRRRFCRHPRADWDTRVTETSAYILCKRCNRVIDRLGPE